MSRSRPHPSELIRHHPSTDFSFHEFIAGPLSSAYGEITIEPPHLTVRLFDEDGRGPE